MSSSRFPGKVLAPFRGFPLLHHVIERVARVIPRSRITVATSTEFTDDPLAGYAATLGVRVHRGPLDNVFERFRGCLAEYPCDWFYRVCADSPLIRPDLLGSLAHHADPAQADIVTNVFPRTFPRGLSAELVRSAAFMAVDGRVLTPAEREHVTLHFYNHPDHYRIVNVPNPERIPDGGDSYTVDTLADIHRLEDAVAAAGENRCG